MMAVYAEAFREEAAELLADLEQALMELEAEPAEMENVATIFRILHTLKGSGAMTGFSQTAALAHEVETLFEAVRDGRLLVDQQLISLALAAKDLLKESVAGELAGTPLSPPRLQAFLQALHQRLPQDAVAETVVLPQLAPGSGEPTLYLIQFRPAPEILLRGIEPAKLLAMLMPLGQCLLVARPQQIPPLTELDPECCRVGWTLLLQTAAGPDPIHDVFMFVADDSELTIEVVAGGAAIDLAADGPALRRLLLEQEGLVAADLLPSLGDRRPAKMAGLSAALRAAEADHLRQEKQASIRVRSERLDNLVNLIGELVIIQSRFGQTIGGRKDPALETLAEEIERLTWELRDEVLQIRMLPLSATFGRMKRLVRDLAADLGKEIELVMTGAETELDKTVIEQIQDPLVHLLRNCVDHGIEPATKRLAQGKPGQGTIRFSAVHSGAQVLLKVSDDGAGLCRQTLVARAVKQGLLESDQGLSDKEVFNLIFAPGFSTAEQVTTVSGRGVGMDVVRRAVEGLRGSLDVTSAPGQGTAFTLKLPLTLAIIDGLLVQLGSEKFVIPLANIEECIELTAAEVARAHGRHLVMIRGELVPYIRLREQFQLDGSPPRIEQVVITNCEGQRIGLVVDKVIGSHQTVIKPMGKMFRQVAGFSGATILGDGRVALILDVPQLVAQNLEQECLPTGT